jgi:two-component system sensor histidine kinase MprB
MRISRRFALAAAVAVAAAIALASVGAYFAVRAQLRSEVDGSLRERASAIQTMTATLGPLSKAGSPSFPGRLPQLPQPVQRFGGAAGVVQFVAADGVAQQPLGPNGAALPVGATTRAVASGRRGTAIEDETVDGDHLRVLTAPLPEGGAVEVARPLDEVDSTLHDLVLLLAAITAGGVALAAALGKLVARTSLAPIRRFTSQTEDIAGHPALMGRRLEVESEDELGRLARSYNTTLEALERSVSAQRQMVSDASHELRTPLASLKANLEVLLRARELGAKDRRELTNDLIEQTDELTWLIEDVVELARGGESNSHPEDVRLEEVVVEAIERVRPHAPGIDFALDVASAAVVRGEPDRLGRAIRNLLENAAKWSPAGGRVEVSVRGGMVSVRDHGPGIEADDLPHVFERFYRSRSARSKPGSGLGLAIVRQVADSHGGRVSAANAPGGGAVLRLWLDVSSGPEPGGA